MSRIDARVNAHLRASAGLVALVGKEIRTSGLGSTGAGVLYHVGPTRPDRAMDGATGWRRSRCSVTVYEPSFAAARATATQVLKAMSRWTDTTGGIRDTFFENEIHDRQGNLWVIEQEYTIHHTT